MLKDKRVLVTGGAGFIGSNLVWALHETNDVVVVDNLSTGRLSNIQPLVDSGKVEFVMGSVTDLQSMKKICTGVEVVFHLAAIPSVPRSVRDPLTSNEANVTGTLTTLLASKDAGVNSFVAASSSSVYGNQERLPKSEDMNVSPISPYAVQKVAGEFYCLVFADVYGMKTTSLRYFNVFGPRQDPESDYAAVIPRFISRAISGRPLTIYGDGTQTRDFTYVKDVVSANMLASEKHTGGRFNIASGSRISVNELAETILSLTGSESDIEHVEPRPGDINHSLADIGRARDELGYIPEYQLKDGLSETVEFFRIHGDRDKV